MKMYIPSIGDRICLKQDWPFTLYAETRNESLGEALKFFDGRLWVDGRNKWGYRENAQGKLVYETPRCRPVAQATIPKSTVLTIDRIYIRKGAKEFNSVTFCVNDAKTIFGVKGKVRFWAKLDDVNKMEFD